jgi:hypothetical protein
MTNQAGWSGAVRDGRANLVLRSSAASNSTAKRHFPMRGASRE